LSYRRRKLRLAKWRKLVDLLGEAQNICNKLSKDKEQLEAVLIKISGLIPVSAFNENPDEDTRAWKSEEVTEKQKNYLMYLGVNPEGIKTKGEASQLIDKLRKEADN
jgi:hypothetical protein